MEMVPLPSGLTVANSASSPFHRTLLGWSWDPGAGRACLLMTAAGGEGFDSRKGLLSQRQGEVAGFIPFLWSKCHWSSLSLLCSVS